MAALFPHPPLIVPEVGGRERDKVLKTAQAMAELAGEIAGLNPQVIVAITPHGAVFSDAVTITAVNPLRGDLAGFGAPQVAVSYDLDDFVVDGILKECREAAIPCLPVDREILREYRLADKLDHGLVVPLSFLEKEGWGGTLVPINIFWLTYEELYHFGSLVAKAMERVGKSWVLLISGDMSHRLTPDAPAGFSPQGAVFDEIIRQCIAEGDVKRLLNLESSLIEEAGECGLRPVIMGLGALDGYEIKSRILSYEGPFGVGYLVAKMLPGKRLPSRDLVQDLYNERKQKNTARHSRESLPVRLARSSIGHYLQRGDFLVPPPETAELATTRAGAFVSLKKDGQLRGCIGTIEAVQNNLAEEIIHNAVSAALHDPRFEPVEAKELEQLEISVDVLDKPERISSVAQLDPHVYGVIVSKGAKKGLLLPHLEGIDAAEEQVRIAKAKAGIGPQENIELQRFRVIRYT